MSYLNIVNPHDKNTSPWVRIPTESRDALKLSLKREDPGEIFFKITEGKSLPDAGQIQTALNSAGFTISHDPKHQPNGVTVSSAGILIAFEQELTAKQEADVMKIIGELPESNHVISPEGTPRDKPEKMAPTSAVI